MILESIAVAVGAVSLVTSLGLMTGAMIAIVAVAVWLVTVRIGGVTRRERRLVANAVIAVSLVTDVLTPAARATFEIFADPAKVCAEIRREGVPAMPRSPSRREDCARVRAEAQALDVGGPEDRPVAESALGTGRRGTRPATGAGLTWSNSTSPGPLHHTIRTDAAERGESVEEWCLAALAESFEPEPESGAS